VPARERMRDRVRLMVVEPIDPARSQGLLQTQIQSLGKGLEDRGGRRQPLDRRDVRVVVAYPRRGLVGRKHP